MLITLDTRGYRAGVGRRETSARARISSRAGPLEMRHHIGARHRPRVPLAAPTLRPINLSRPNQVSLAARALHPALPDIAAADRRAMTC